MGISFRRRALFVLLSLLTFVLVQCASSSLSLFGRGQQRANKLQKPQKPTSLFLFGRGQQRANKLQKPCKPTLNLPQPASAQQLANIFIATLTGKLYFFVLVFAALDTAWLWLDSTRLFEDVFRKPSFWTSGDAALIKAFKETEDGLKEYHAQQGQKQKQKQKQKMRPPKVLAEYVDLRVGSQVAVAVNAFVKTSLFAPNVVVVTRGLLNMRLPSKLYAAVLAHELGHLHLCHVPLRLSALALSESLVMVVETMASCDKRRKVLIRDAIIADTEIADPSSPGALRFSNNNSRMILLGINGLNFAFHHLMLSLCRTNEFAADEFAAEVIGFTEMILALQAVHGISPWVVKLQWALGLRLPAWLFKMKKPTACSAAFDFIFKPVTHPSLYHRITYLEQVEAQRKKG